MDEQTSWKGQSFTLLIFGGIVVLCSIFFILGMLVARDQMASLSAVALVSDEGLSEGGEDEARIEEEESDDLDLGFYEALDGDEPPTLEAALPAAPPPPEPAPEPEPAAVIPEVAPAITLQIAALTNADQAETLRDEIASQGLPAFVLQPGPDDVSALHRVQVGPFSDQAEVARVRALLEAEGYEPIVRN